MYEPRSWVKYYLIPTPPPPLSLSAREKRGIKRWLVNCIGFAYDGKIKADNCGLEDGFSWSYHVRHGDFRKGFNGGKKETHDVTSGDPLRVGAGIWTSIIESSW